MKTESYRLVKEMEHINPTNVDCFKPIENMSTLIPQTLLEMIPDLYETEEISDPICHIKLFTPDSNWTWYVIEFSKEDSKTCFGFVQGMESELGYFSLDDLELLRGSLGLPIERDLSFKSTLLSKIKSVQ